MNKQDAEMWCRVARRIGLEQVSIGPWTEKWHVLYHEPEAMTGEERRVFNPPANPADERMLWDHLDKTDWSVSVVRHKGDVWDAFVYADDDNHGRARHPDRVSALIAAIDALPEGV